MEYVRDVNIIEAVVHVLDTNSDKPILNEYKIDLTEEVYKFLYKHIEKAFRDEKLKYAKFNPEKGLVKKVTQEYLNGENTDIIEISKEIASQMFLIMKSNCNIPSCDLIVVSMSTNQGPMLGILKMDYIKNFTHKVVFENQKVGIGIIEQAAGLPSSSQRVQNCAFIKPIRENNEVDVMLIDNHRRATAQEDYGADYFKEYFLGCTIVSNERDMTKNFIRATEYWIQNNIYEDAAKAVDIRSKIKNKLNEQDNIEIGEFSKELFEDNNEFMQDSFRKSIIMQCASEEIKVDKEYINKKFKRTRLKIDKDIDLYINTEAYNDKSRFDIQKNGDGSINIVIKNVMNYIEK